MYCLVLYCIVLYCIVLYCIVLYCVVLYCIVLYCIVLYCIVLYCVVLYCIVLYCIVLYLYCIVFTIVCIVLYLYCIVFKRYAHPAGLWRSPGCAVVSRCEVVRSPGCAVVSRCEVVRLRRWRVRNRFPPYPIHHGPKSTPDRGAKGTCRLFRVASFASFWASFLWSFWFILAPPRPPKMVPFSSFSVPMPSKPIQSDAI